MPAEKSKFITKTRQQLYDMYMNSLNENELPWEKPWTTSGISNPANPVSHTQYKGVNRFLLWMVSDMRGIEDGRWATFNQIADVNSKYHPNQKWHLKKGSKGIPVELWKIRKVGTKELIDFDDYAKIVKDDPDQRKNYTLYAQMFYVYNYADIDGVPEKKIERTDAVSIPDLEAFCDEVLKNTGVGLVHGGDNAYYTPAEDKIHLPELNRFETAEDYYATRLHETAHSTGAPGRLNRDLSGGFGSESYAKEELRAEIASSLLFADLHLPSSAKTLDNHKAYIQNWISVLKKDPNVLFAAIKDAEKISSYVEKNAPLALDQIRKHEKEDYQEYVKAQIKEDHDQKRISEEEYRYLSRNVGKISDSMADEGQDSGHEKYEAVKIALLVNAGLQIVDDLAKENQLDLQASIDAAVIMP